MLSATEVFDFPPDVSLDVHDETADDLTNRNPESLNIQQNKGFKTDYFFPLGRKTNGHVYLGLHSDNDNDRHQNENNQSNNFVQFLRSMSTNVQNNQDEQRIQLMPSMSINSTRNSTLVSDATQLLLTRLGIIRRKSKLFTNHKVIAIIWIFCDC